MTWPWTYNDLRVAIREGSGGKGPNLQNERALINRAVRLVSSDVDLRSAKRRQALSPNLTSEYDYTLPTNLKGFGIIDIQKQANRGTRQSSEFQLTTPEEFDRLKKIYPNLFTVTEFDNQRIVRISGVVDDAATVIHSMDGITSNGTWSADSDNTAANDLDTSTSDNFTGSSNLVWDIDTTGTSATIQNSSMTAVNITNYKRDGGYIFLKQYIPASGSELAKITSFRLQIGSDSNNYYQDTATTNTEGISFQNGLQTLRFSFPSTALAGTPSDTAIDYVRLGVVLSSAFTNEIKGWRTDAITARQGSAHNMLYYTDYLWDSGAARLSVGDTDTLMAYDQEVELFVERGIQLVARALGDKERAGEAAAEYDKKKQEYQMSFPSESKILSTYFSYLPDSTEDVRNSIDT